MNNIIRNTSFLLLLTYSENSENKMGVKLIRCIQYIQRNAYYTPTLVGVYPGTDLHQSLLTVHLHDSYKKDMS